MTRIVLSTGNIVSGGPSIIRKPGTHRSNLEFTASLESNFESAQEEYAAVLQNGNGTAHEIDHGRTNGVVKRPATEVWTETEDGVLYVPRIDWASAGLQEPRDQYEITLKLFFPPTAPADRRPEFVNEALRLVQKELGIQDVDLLIVSFPGISFEGDCEWEADKLNASMGNDEEEVKTWVHLEALHKEGRIKNLGIAEFGSQKLSRFLEKVSVAPTVDQINVKNCCNVPPPLKELAKEKGIELLTHSDCTDILPSGTLRTLLGQGPQGAGVLADGEIRACNGLKGDLVPEWVVKYTAFVKNRGVIENKGYFAGAELMAI